MVWWFLDFPGPFGTTKLPVDGSVGDFARREVAGWTVEARETVGELSRDRLAVAAGIEGAENPGLDGERQIGAAHGRVGGRAPGPRTMAP
jgi:hypothetical protein